MSKLDYTEEDIVGIEPKHITYVTDQNGKLHDLHVVKEVVHLKDKRRVSRLRKVEDYTRYYYITHKGQANHSEKKDYEFMRNLKKYSTTQIGLTHSIQKALRGYVTPDGQKVEYNPRPRMKQLARIPYVYGADVNSTCCLKNDYREQWPGLNSRNTVAGGDIETNVYEDGKDGEIICMSVTHKDKVYLAYLKRWVHDIADPIGETHAELERIPELVTLKKARNLNITVEILNTPAQIVIECIKRLHEWQPDFFAFWNMDFDMSRMLRALEQHGVDPKDVFSDPSIPNNYKYFHYKVDEAMSTTASDVTKSKGPEDQWHWVTAPASFQCIDGLSTYRVTRLAKGKEPSYALDYILKKELSVDDEEEITTETDLKSFLDSCKKKMDERSGSHPYWSVSNPNDDIVTKTMIAGENDNDPDIEHIDREPVWKEVTHLEYQNTVMSGYKVRMVLNFGKLKFPETDRLTGIEWHIEMQKNHKIRYGLYNIIDSIRLEQLDEKTNDLARSITLYSKNSDYKNFNSNPKRLCDDMHFWYLKRPDPCVIGTSSDQMMHELDQYVVSHSGWIVTLPSFMAGPNGIKCVKEFPDYRSLIWCHVADLDIVSTYPTVSQILNIARETTVMEFSAIWGVSENNKRAVGVNLTGCKTNALEIAQTIYKAPKLDDLLAGYLKRRGSVVDTTPK